MDEDEILEYDNNLRLECVRMALCVHGQGSADRSVLGTAKAMYEFVTGADEDAVTQ